MKTSNNTQVLKVSEFIKGSTLNYYGENVDVKGLLSYEGTLYVRLFNKDNNKVTITTVDDLFEGIRSRSNKLNEVIPVPIGCISSEAFLSSILKNK